MATTCLSQKKYFGFFPAGKHPLGNPTLASWRLGFGSVCVWGCLMVRLGRAVQGHRAGSGVLLSAPRAGRDEGRALKAASVGCEPPLTPD